MCGTTGKRLDHPCAQHQQPPDYKASGTHEVPYVTKQKCISASAIQFGHLMDKAHVTGEYEGTNRVLGSGPRRLKCSPGPGLSCVPSVATKRLTAYTKRHTRQNCIGPTTCAHDCQACLVPAQRTRKADTCPAPHAYDLPFPLLALPCPTVPATCPTYHSPCTQLSTVRAPTKTPRGSR